MPQAGLVRGREHKGTEIIIRPDGVLAKFYSTPGLRLWFHRDESGTLLWLFFFITVTLLGSLFYNDFSQLHLILPSSVVFLLFFVPSGFSLYPHNSNQWLVVVLYFFFGGIMGCIYLPCFLLALICRKFVQILALSSLPETTSYLFKNWHRIPRYAKILYYAVAILSICIFVLAMLVLVNCYMHLNVVWKLNFYDAQLSEITNQINYMKFQINELYELVYNLQEDTQSVKDNFEIFKAQVNTGLEYIHHTIDDRLNDVITKMGIEDVKNHEYIASIEKTLIQLHGERTWYRLGCLPAGTLITVDRVGNTDYVERIKKGSVIYSPILDAEITVELSRAGPETGDLLKFTLDDNITAKVTSGHAMLVEPLIVNGKYGKQENMAARDVKIGDIMTTIHGKQKVTTIEKLPVVQEPVYNFRLSIPTSSNVLSRVVIVNGIQMLDLHAQEILAPWWQQIAAYCVSLIL